MNDNIAITEPKRPHRRLAKNGLTMQLIIAETRAGKTIKQIAASYGVTEQAIRLRCKKHGFSAMSLRAYKESKADIFAWKQSQLIESMTPEKIAQASLRDQATTFNILHNAERLERGQSTQNVDFQAMGMQLSELEKQEELLKAELAKLQATAETVEPIEPKAR